MAYTSRARALLQNLATLTTVSLISTVVFPGAALAAGNPVLTSATVNGSTSITVAPSASITLAVLGHAHDDSDKGDWSSTNWRIATADGTRTCALNSSSVTNKNSDESRSFTITAPATDGTYNVYIQGFTSDTCSTSGGHNSSNTLTLSAAVTVLTDTTPPTVSSIVRAASSPTNAASVSWTVTFSESVTGVNTADFSLANAGLTSPSITGVSGSGTTYTVTASTGSGTGTLGLNLVDDDTIVDSQSNKLGGTGASNGNFTGEVYSVDLNAPSAPTVSSPSSGTRVNTSGVTVSGTSEANATIDITGGSSAAQTTANGSGAWSTTVFLNFGVNVDTTNTLSVTATDAVGNVSSGTSLSVVMDNTTPDVTVSTGTSNPTNVSPIPVSIVFNENVADFDVGDISVSGGAAGNFQSTDAQHYTADITPSSDPASVSVSVAVNAAHDSAGNGNDVSNTLTRSFDGTAPSVTITSGPGEGSYTNATGPTFVFSMANGTGVSCAVDSGSFGTCSGATTSHTLSALGDGAHSFSVKATDGVNPDATATVNFTVDTVLPVPSIASSAVFSGMSSTTPLSVSITFSEGVTGFDSSDVGVSGNASISNFAGSGTSYTFDLTITSQGATTIDVAAGVATEANGSGNLNAAATQLSFTADNTAPVIGITSGPGDGSTSSSTSATFQFTVSDTNSTTASCSLDGAGTTTPCSSPQAFSSLSEGSHTFRIEAQDAAGNRASLSRTFTVDTTPPILAEVTAVPTPSQDTTPTATFSSTESGTVSYGGSCTSSTSAASSGNNTITFNALSVGTYSDCRIAVTDSAGNTSSALTLTSFTIESAPTPSPTPAPSGGGGNGPIAGSLPAPSNAGGGSSGGGAGGEGPTSNTTAGGTLVLGGEGGEAGGQVLGASTGNTQGGGSSGASGKSAVGAAMEDLSEEQSAAAATALDKEADFQAAAAGATNVPWWLSLLILLVLALGGWYWWKQYRS